MKWRKLLKQLGYRVLMFLLCSVFAIVCFFGFIIGLWSVFVGWSEINLRDTIENAYVRIQLINGGLLLMTMGFICIMATMIFAVLFYPKLTEWFERKLE